VELEVVELTVQLQPSISFLAHLLAALAAAVHQILAATVEVPTAAAGAAVALVMAAVDSKALAAAAAAGYLLG
jgi:hypothetical protein